MAGRDREVGRVDEGRTLAAILGEGSAGRFLGERERERESTCIHVHTLSGHVLLTKLGSWMAVLGFM